MVSLELQRVQTQLKSAIESSGVLPVGSMLAGHTAGHPADSFASSPAARTDPEWYSAANKR